MIFVESEFAPLRTVVLAESEFGMPEVSREEDVKFLTPEAREDLHTKSALDYGDAYPENQQPDILHLDCAFGFIRNGLMVVCEEAFKDGIPERLRTWDRINVTY